MQNSSLARLQDRAIDDQTLVLARLVSMRSDGGVFSPADVTSLFSDLALPAPAKTSNVLARLKSQRLIVQGKARGQWKITPHGRSAADALIEELNLYAAGSANVSPAGLAGIRHGVLPPELGPIELRESLHAFCEEFPFDQNVFAMTRFPSSSPDGLPDPVAAALEAARAVCADHGMTLHLASDRLIVDGLWSNVAAHMWACRYGIAFFEDRVGRSLNYNLTIEVGSMLMAGRRCALLKDTTVDSLPTDLVGHVYKSVDLEDLDTVRTAISDWLGTDLALDGRR